MAHITLYMMILLGLALIGAMAYAIIIHIKLRQTEELLKHGYDKLEQLQLDFGRFTPQEVIEEITGPGGGYQPRIKEVTVLFADLKGFTKLCASKDPATIVSILNGYFQAMSKAIISHHGRVTELTGDGILALFGAVRTNPWQIQDAVMAALSMRTGLKKYNEELKLKSLPELTFGIGIHHGELLVGVMGNLDVSKFGVVGDSINVASRIETLTRIHNKDVLISDVIRDKLDDRFVLHKMPPTPVKGKEKPVVSYFVEGMKGQDV